MMRSRSGSAAVEFALILVPFVLLLFGGMEFGRLIWTRNALQQTAFATARCMGVRQAPCATGLLPDVARSVTFARTRAASFSVAVPAAAVVATAAGTCASQGGFSRVTISTSFRTIIPLLRPILGEAYPIRVVACFPNQT
ncbi:TadE/TadG family type IV pilus assembly protein [Glacieibacterium frigidum]|uniref:Pilus assembly protein n=1 Tax=Glacieibacterium frigidum TaxID=2593303 RepID=A0A552UGH3_9SPHN|nr:TadE family protein [Glacieibacterium frigidum]TRW17315.1 pilus assembly protein [Glacieibacterium frigidum]